MAFPVVPCERRSGVNEVGAAEVHRRIRLNPTMSIERFEKIRGVIPGYHLTNGGASGWNALMAVAQHGNVKLIEHIVQVGGKELLELGNINGVTPLLAAVFFSQYKAAKKLIELGAYINRATAKATSYYIPANVTPLWAAACCDLIKNDPDLIRFLLRNDAALSPMPTTGEPEVLKQLRKEIKKERNVIAKPIKRITKLPLELAHLVTRYAESND